MGKETYLNKKIVVDTSTSWIYIGTFISEDEKYLILEKADAYDISETTLSKQEYLLRVKQDGIVANREKVKILKDKIVAITILEDILEK